MAATIIEVLQKRIKQLEREVRNMERRLKELELAASNNSVRDEIAELRKRVEGLASFLLPIK